MGCLLFRVVELERLIKLPCKETRLLAKPMKRTKRGVVFFSWGTKAFCVDLLLGNVLPFENNMEGKSCVIGFEMLWLIFFFFFFLLNVRLAVFSHRWKCSSEF